jgi:hypothetical protein
MTREETLEPSNEEFVLRVDPADATALARARGLGAMEQLESARGLCLLRLPPRTSSKDAWQAATQALGSGIALFPVLYDPTGVAHYPTGEVTVRFEKAPSDADLRHFCDAQGLRLLRRNEYVAQQVVCEAVAPGAEFLPDLVARVAAQPGVYRAWANTLSRYRRAAK